MKEIRSKIENSWKALLNLVCAIRLTQEIQKRNEIPKIDETKNCMITEFSEEKEHLMTKEEFEDIVNLETISTENLPVKSVTADQSTGSLIASVSSCQHENEIPLNAEFDAPPPFVKTINDKVELDLSKKPVLKGCEIQGPVKPSPKKTIFKPRSLIMVKEDLIRLPGKCRLSRPTAAPLLRSLSVGEEQQIKKGGIFEQRKKMFERSEELILTQKSRVVRSPRSKSARL